ncbi:response regulator [Ramlibacter albus]|uniref:Response regulator n=1 Tax=Ramlibacter albus TaxID=2079448 RepID=A0A923M8K4_9BURK|nr:response regulator [Ramlibacter albus]MBC5765990.1 response regulator [Ramlibacter albus]
MPGNTILVVEDNEKNRRLLRKVLEVTGYTVVEVETGEAGVQAAREHKPDLVLMDYQLPDIDGIEVFNRIRADASIPRMPIIAVTASAMPEDQKRMKDAGFDGFETKPISVTALLANVARFLPPPAKP